ncbi:MAG TPA: isocitrate lyase ICL2 [Candidatus Limnocylindrales bacterium]|nr:isocitrate lyase ICL2 [Candidatus Limnocylindrales bacterium]
MSPREAQLAAASEWFAQPRFDGIVRLHTAREVAAQQGTIQPDYTVARTAAEAFHARLRELFSRGEQITTFGPYSPGQAVVMKRLGIEAIYLGGWATSAKGSTSEDPGPDLASYPLGQVPDEAAGLVRALLAADKNQHFARTRMDDAQRRATPAVDFRPFIIADADTGHGGDAHVRNLIRRFVEIGVPGYHIEDQKPGAKKCGHQSGKVLVAQDEQNKRLNAARLQLDVMRVPGIIVARTDAEAATFLDNRSDERDQPFILGATNLELPSYRIGFLAIQKTLHDLGCADIRGHLLFAVPDDDMRNATSWLVEVGLMALVEETAETIRETGGGVPIDDLLDAIDTRYAEIWQSEADLKTCGQAVADILELRISEGERFAMTVEEWQAFAAGASFSEVRAKADALDIRLTWDAELPKTPDGYYQVRGGIDYAIAKSLAAAPFADLLWMETKTADLEDARRFAEAIHARYPDKMLAYNLSPSFNWDTTGLSDDEMRRFPEDLGKLGFVFNFITYGGHQIDGLAAEEFATALRDDGMLALARLQRKFRLLESPYRTPQTLVGGDRLDAALMAVSGRTAATKAMGKGSTQHQHLVQTEVPTRLLEGWLATWATHWERPANLRVELRPHTAGSDLLELRVVDDSDDPLANVIFASIVDRRGRSILSIRDQNTAAAVRRRRLMTLVQLFLIHRYRALSLHYLTPTEDNRSQTQRMQDLGIFSIVRTEIGQIIVADVNRERIVELVRPEGDALAELIGEAIPQHA